MTTFIVPAAGLGSRFQELYPGIPKPLIPIDGIPMIELVLTNLGVRDKDHVIVIGRAGTGIGEWHPSFMSNAVFQYVEIQNLSCGPACTVHAALEFVSECGPVIVLNSDQFISGGLSKFVAKLESMTDSGLIMTMTASGNRWSYVERQGQSVRRVVEKLQVSDEATTGVYGWSSKKLLEMALNGGLTPDYLVNGEYYVAPTYNFLIENGFEVQTLHIGDLARSMAGLGTPTDLATSLNSAWFKKELKDAKDYIHGRTNPAKT